METRCRWNKRTNFPEGTSDRQGDSTPAERFEFYTVRSDGPDDCWMWRGGTLSEKRGREYGMFWDGTRVVLAHRFAYEHFVGPIPDGYEIDHTCETPRCVRPDHLEAVTHRSTSSAAASGRTTQIPRADRVNLEINRPDCPKCGTPYTTTKNGARYCKPCANANAREWTRRTGTSPGKAPGFRNREKTHCGICGTPYDEENTYNRPDGGRDCRACKIERQARAESAARARICPPGCTCGRHRRKSPHP